MERLSSGLSGEPAQSCIKSDQTVMVGDFGLSDLYPLGLHHKIWTIDPEDRSGSYSSGRTHPLRKLQCK